MESVFECENNFIRIWWLFLFIIDVSAVMSLMMLRSMMPQGPLISRHVRDNIATDQKSHLQPQILEELEHSHWLFLTPTLSGSRLIGYMRGSSMDEC